MRNFKSLTSILLVMLLCPAFSNAGSYVDRIDNAPGFGQMVSGPFYWSHSLDTSLGIPSSARVELDLWDIDDPEQNPLYADGHFLGYLWGHTGQPSVNTFDLTPYISDLQDGILNMELNWSGSYISQINSSTLYVEYNQGQTQSLQVINAFPSPGDNPRGLAWDGTYLWHCDWVQKKIYQLDTSGNIISFIDWPYREAYGLAYDGNNLWVCDNDQDSIYEVTKSGEILSSFSPGHLYGAGWDGSNLWITADNSSLYKVTKTGEVLADYQIGDLAWASDLAFDGISLWLANYNGTIAMLSKNGEVLDTFDIEGNPIGIAWDGNYLWYADDASDMIYQVQVTSGSTTTTTVDPNITSTTTTLSSSSTSPSTTTTTGISLQPPAIFSNKIYKTRIISTAGYYLPYPYIENCDLAFMWAGPFADELDLDESVHLIAVRTSYSSEGSGVCRALNYFTFDGGLIIGDAYNPGLVITHMVGFSTGLTIHAIGLVGNQEAMITGVAFLFGIYDSDVLTPY